MSLRPSAEDGLLQMSLGSILKTQSRDNPARPIYLCGCGSASPVKLELGENM